MKKVWQCIECGHITVYGKSGAKCANCLGRLVGLKRDKTTGTLIYAVITKDSHPEVWEALEGKDVKMRTICTYCGCVSTIMQLGNGCHNCQKGYMKEAKLKTPEA